MTEVSASSYGLAVSAKTLARKFLSQTEDKKVVQVVMRREFPSPLIIKRGLLLTSLHSLHSE